MFISDQEPLLVKKIVYRYYNLSELITKPTKLKMLYIARQGEWRQIINENNMIDNITTEYKDFVEVEKTWFEGKTHRSQILQMRNTDILLGYHGAAFVNIMFMMPYSGFIEILSPIVQRPYYMLMSNKTRIVYRSVVNNTVADFSKKPPLDGRDYNIFVNIDIVMKYTKDLINTVTKMKYEPVLLYDCFLDTHTNGHHFD